MVELELAASVEGVSGQLFVWPKSPGFVPPRAMLLMVNGAVPVFEIGRASCRVGVQMGGLAKGADEGVSVAADAVPVPERLAVCGLPLASSVTVKVAARAAVPRCLNLRWMLQLELAASVEGVSGQLFVWPKSPGFVPPRAMPLMVNGAVPVFESVTVCGALVVLTG